MTDPILYEVRDGAAWITFNSPSNHNALTDAFTAGFERAVQRAIGDDAARAIVLAGVGKTFCAGADLKNAGGSNVGRPGAKGGHPPFPNTLLTLWNSPKPVIGRVQGNAWGGGLGVVASCDYVIMAEGTRFAFTEVRLGLIPAVISVFCSRKMPYTHVAPMMLTGQRFDARRAFELGLAHEVVPEARLDERVQAIVNDVRECGPQAVAEVRKLLRAVTTHSVEEGLHYAEDAIARLFKSAEGSEGMAAFNAKRKPAWAPPAR
ncbi:MAG: enoyl-CoA hydratase/isomerase family protein [Candidatus Lambdaproteobacteria bacterium]|nr:enoyl-CoA hydratase/isomerase family protein [Candidatus Lambdaproteobacteria bacterium]